MMRSARLRIAWLEGTADLLRRRVLCFPSWISESKRLNFFELGFPLASTSLKSNFCCFMFEWIDDSWLLSFSGTMIMACLNSRTCRRAATILVLVLSLSLVQVALYYLIASSFGISYLSWTWESGLTNCISFDYHWEESLLSKSAQPSTKQSLYEAIIALRIFITVSA